MPARMSNEHLIEYTHTYAECLNIRYFDGALRFETNLARRESRTWYARVWAYKPPLIEFNPVMAFATIYELEEVIAHELIHVAQAQLGLPRGHGQSFKKLAKMFQIPQESSTSCCSDRVRHPTEMKLGRPPKYEPQSR